MATARVNCGGCGYTATLRVTQNGDGTVAVDIDSECAALDELAARLQAVEPYGEMGNLLHSATFKAAGDCLHHSGCPVPTAVLKAIEVEAGVALPSTVTIEIVRDDS